MRLLRLQGPEVSIAFGVGVMILVNLTYVVQRRSLQAVRSLGLLLLRPAVLLLELMALRRWLLQSGVDLRRVALPFGGPASKTSRVVVGAWFGETLAWRRACLLCMAARAGEDALDELALRLLLAGLRSLRVLAGRVSNGAREVFKRS